MGNLIPVQNLRTILVFLYTIVCEIIFSSKNKILNNTVLTHGAFDIQFRITNLERVFVLVCFANEAYFQGNQTMQVSFVCRHSGYS